MGSIIRYLFGCEIAFPKSWSEENQYGALIEAARQMDERAKALFGRGTGRLLGGVSGTKPAPAEHGV